jgi:endonuclease/exonuclease/phosphatase family metal-dependent hydrolase
MIMKSFIKYFSSFVFISVSFAQNQHTIMTYNILNYPFTDTTSRNPHFRTIFANIQPDILVVQEIVSQSAVNAFLNNILNQAASGYSAGTFINGPDLDRTLFFKCSIFTFISNTPIATPLRDINEFKLSHNTTGDTLIIYAVHLKANVEDSLLRAAEVDSLRKRTNILPPNTNFIVAGDFNIYGSGEPSYQRLINQSAPGYFVDPLNLAGPVWNVSANAQYHTQSTRTRAFGDGATGGLDDRFDMILMSQSIMDEGGITFISGSYTEYGNDGNHFNDSINQPPNTAVGQQIADALHYATDHLPVIASFNFETQYVELTSFTALIEGLYNGASMIPDTVTVELRNTSSPYNLIDLTKIFLNSSGQGTGKFYNAENGIPYYLVLKHRNAVETWSSASQTFTSGELVYDFTSAQNKAYGNNLKLVGSKWCIYGGDVNQDGFVNALDVNAVYSNNINGITGYSATDLNGDMFTEVEDISRVFINNVLGIERKRP